MARVLEIRDIKHANYYDCVDIVDGGFGSAWSGDGQRGGSSVRLFGNANIGNIDLTNLQIPGQMPSDESWIVQRWYARHNFPLGDPAVRDLYVAWANSVTATFTIGMRPVWTRSLAELVERRPRSAEEQSVVVASADPWPALVPTRQNFSIAVEQFGWAITDFAPNLRRDGFRPRVWFHLEGIQFDPNTVDGAKIITSLTRNIDKRESIEDAIANWLGLEIEKADPENRAQLHAVRDGVLEGRHRS